MRCDVVSVSSERRGANRMESDQMRDRQHSTTTSRGIEHLGIDGMAGDTLLLSAREAARQLSVSTRTLWALTQPRGTLPCVRVGSRVLYSRQTLVEWIAAQAAGGAR